MTTTNWLMLCKEIISIALTIRQNNNYSILNNVVHTVTTGHEKVKSIKNNSNSKYHLLYRCILPTTCIHGFDLTINNNYFLQQH
jgi:hypothetical protein